MFFACLALIFTSTPCRTLAEHTVRPPDSADWRPVPSSGVIGTPGNYFLPHDVSTDRQAGLKIEADDVVVDFRGHALRYGGAPKEGVFGVVASQRKNVTIRNGILGGFWFNIHCTENRNLTIEEIAFDDIPYIGINAAESRHVQIRRNRFTNFRYDIPKAKDTYVIAINIGAEDAVISENRFEAVAPGDGTRPVEVETVFVLFSAEVSRRCVVALNHMEANRVLARGYGVWVATNAQVAVLYNEIKNMQYAVCLAHDASALVSRNRFLAEAASATDTSNPTYGVYASEPKELAILFNAFKGIMTPTHAPDGIVNDKNSID